MYEVWQPLLYIMLQEQHTGTDAGPALNAAAAGETHVQTSQQVYKYVNCLALVF